MYKEIILKPKIVHKSGTIASILPHFLARSADGVHVSFHLLNNRKLGHSYCSIGELELRAIALLNSPLESSIVQMIYECNDTTQTDITLYYLSEPLSFVHSGSMDKQWMKEHSVSHLHGQMNPGSIGVKVPDAVVQLVHTSLNKQKTFQSSFSATCISIIIVL